MTDQNESAPQAGQILDDGNLGIEQELVPPPGFKFDPDLLADYEEQIQYALAMARYQVSPKPSFEGVPTLDVKPEFNPTNAPEEEIFARGRAPKGRKTHAEVTGSSDPVEAWRIVERSRLIDGTALVSSSILLNNSVGNIEGMDAVRHSGTDHEKRMSGQGKATPFVSFTTDPEFLAKSAVLGGGFGVRNGRDSVVVQITVDPDRIVSDGRNKSEEVLLVGGVAPSEYTTAYNIEDFVRACVPESHTTTVRGEQLRIGDALRQWSEKPDLRPK